MFSTFRAGHALPTDADGLPSLAAAVAAQHAARADPRLELLAEACHRDDVLVVQTTMRNINVTVSTPMGHGVTVLMLAAGAGATTVTQWLLDQGAKPLAADEDGDTALHFACNGMPRIPVLRVLLPDEHAAPGGMPADRVRELRSALEMRNVKRTTPLLQAAYSGSVPAFEFLLAQGADVAAVDADGDTMLHIAAMLGHTALVRAAVAPGCKAAPLLEVVGQRGFTPLLSACFHGHRAAAESLLNVGANLHATTTSGRGVLAVAAQKSAADFVAWLLSRGAPINHADDDGITALLIAALAGNAAVCRELLAQGANIRAATSRQMTAVHLAAGADCADALQAILDRWALLRARPEEWGVVNIVGDSPLHSAIEKRASVHVVRMLVGAGIDAGAVNGRGYTAAHVAAQYNHTEVLAWLVQEDLPLDLNATSTVSYASRTALHVAAAEGTVECVRILVDAGVDLDKADAHGSTALHLAIKGGSLSIVKALWMGGCNIRAKDLAGREALEVAHRLPSSSPLAMWVSAHSAAWEPPPSSVPWTHIKPRAIPRISVVDFVATNHVEDSEAQVLLAEAGETARRVQGLEMESYGFLHAAAHEGCKAVFIKGMSDAGARVRGGAATDRRAIGALATASSALAAFMYLSNKWWGGILSVRAGADRPAERAAERAAAEDGPRRFDVLLLAAKPSELDSTLRTFELAAAAWGKAGGVGALTLDAWSAAVSDDGCIPAVSTVLRWHPCATDSPTAAHAPPDAAATAAARPYNLQPLAEPWSITIVATSPTRAGALETAGWMHAAITKLGKPTIAIMTGMAAALVGSGPASNRLCDALVCSSAIEWKLDAHVSSAAGVPPRLDMTRVATAFDGATAAFNIFARLKQVASLWAGLWERVAPEFAPPARVATIMPPAASTPPSHASDAPHGALASLPPLVLDAAADSGAIGGGAAAGPDAVSRRAAALASSARGMDIHTPDLHHMTSDPPPDAADARVGSPGAAAAAPATGALPSAAGAHT